MLAWKHFERTALQRASAVVVFSDRDAAAIRELDSRIPITRVEIAPSLSGPLDPLGREPPRLLFVGSFTHAPNVDAAVRLAREIFPSLDDPAAALVLVGHAPSPEVRALAGERIFVHADVPDVVPYLDEAAVVVAPMRTGGGMRVKVLDALAAGKALVASARAVEGLGVVPGEHFSLAETNEQFVRAIARLLRDRERRAALATAAHEWAAANLSWDRTARAFENLHERLIAEAPG
jgi:glycosyltransferase involved in cell wall biosynthesis